MHCPECDAVQPDFRAVCTMCGEVFTDIDEAACVCRREYPPEAECAGSMRETLAEENRAGTRFEVMGDTSLREAHPVFAYDAWIHLCVGGLLAGLIFAFPIIRIGFDGLVTLVHEMGHAAFGWLFGRVSIPGFDLKHGGGVTMIPDQTPLLLILIYAGFVGLIWMFRRNKLTCVMIAVAVLVYAVCAHTRLNDIIILFMGHGTELVIATVFLYRALSGKAVINPLERPLYAICGWFILFRGTFFAFSLVTDHEAVLQYRKGKGGHAHDFVRIAEELLHVDLSLVAAIFLFCCLIPLAASILMFCCQEWFHTVMSRLTSRE